MRANRLDAMAGLRWIGEAFLAFRVAPLRQLAGCLAFLFALTVALAIPLVGFALVWLLIPALLVGPHAVARMASRGATPQLALLVSGFRGDFAAQLRLGGVYLAIIGGAAALETTWVEQIEEVDLDDLNPESLWKFRVKGFGPLLVAMDSHGANRYTVVNQSARDKRADALAALGVKSETILRQE